MKITKTIKDYQTEMKALSAKLNEIRQQIDDLSCRVNQSHEASQIEEEQNILWDFARDLDMASEEITSLRKSYLDYTNEDIILYSQRN